MGRITPLLTSLKVLNITYPSPYETLLETPETLPTTEPETPQVSYTVASGDLPALAFPVASKVWMALIYAAGKFVTAGTLSWRLKKNGTSVASGSGAVAAGNYYTCNGGVYDIAVDDVLEIALWSNQTDSEYDWKGMQVQVTRIQPFPRIRLLMGQIYTGAYNPTFALGTPTVETTRATAFKHTDFTFNTPSTLGPVTYASVYLGETYGQYALGQGDDITEQKNTIMIRPHATARPFYRRNITPIQMVFRGMKID